MRAVQNDTHERCREDGKLNSDRVEVAHYHIQHWCKRLEQATKCRSGILYSEVDTIILEMKSISNEYAIKQMERLLQLARVDETLLRQYNSLNV